MSYSFLTPGPTIVWANSPSGGQLGLAATSLASGAACQGDKSPTLLDATKGLAEWIYCLPETIPATAPADFLNFEWWLGWSDSATPATNNPAGLTGVSGAFASPGSAKNLLTFVGSIISSNAIGAALHRQDPFFVRVKNICFIPLLANSSGVALSAVAGSTKFSVTPFYRVNQ